MSGETVRLVRSSGQGTTRRFHTHDYHYVRDFGDNMQEWDRDLAEAWGYEQCTACQDLEARAPQGGDSS